MCYVNIQTYFCLVYLDYNCLEQGSKNFFFFKGQQVNIFAFFFGMTYCHTTTPQFSCDILKYYIKKWVWLNYSNNILFTKIDSWLDLAWEP